MQYPPALISHLRRGAFHILKHDTGLSINEINLRFQSPSHGQEEDTWTDRNYVIAEFMVAKSSKSN